jgi:hypothetical protein
MRSVLAGITTIMLLALSTPARADASAPPHPDGITVELVTANGTGCGGILPTVSVTPDGSGFKVYYDTYVAAVGAGARPVESRRNCHLGLLIHVPSGYTWAIDEVTHDGLVDLEPGATAMFRHTHYIAGQAPKPLASHSFHGPVTDLWRAIDAYPQDELVYTPCGLTPLLNIRTELRAAIGTSDPAKASFIAIESEFFADATYRLAWKRCP